jgi:hypothetical protein
MEKSPLLNSLFPIGSRQNVVLCARQEWVGSGPFGSVNLMSAFSQKPTFANGQFRLSKTLSIRIGIKDYLNATVQYSLENWGMTNGDQS